MEHKIAETNARIDVADVLRGLAVMGIILLHSIEHFNFYSFPEEVPFEWMKFTDQAIWRGLFFTFSNKAYAVFALLFGFSFYIQDNNQQRRGKDFRLRFLWRLFILFMIGQFNAAFFTGEILTMYAILGIILPIFCRMSDRTVVIFATLLILQPIDWVKLIYALCNPDYVAGNICGDRQAFRIRITPVSVRYVHVPVPRSYWPVVLPTYSCGLFQGSCHVFVRRKRC